MSKPSAVNGAVADLEAQILALVTQTKALETALNILRQRVLWVVKPGKPQ